MKILNTQAYTFWLLIEAVLISITILFIPFGILGICFVVGLILFICSVVSMAIKGSWVMATLGLIGALLSISCTVGFVIPDRTYTKYYEPKLVYRTASQIVLITDTKVVTSDNLSIYNKKSFVCKDERYNHINVRLHDTWYACEKQGDLK